MEFFFFSRKPCHTYSRSFRFKIISLYPSEKMYPGQIIEYTVKPFLGIPLYWMTEITHVEDQKFFIDNQRYGLYSMWHHQHHFKEVENGVEITDIIHYKLPLWFLGDIANTLFVKNQLTKYLITVLKKPKNYLG